MSSILIVDDELSMRQFLTHLFERESYEVRVADNGRQAMALLHEHPADLIITDVKMPDMGGIDLLRVAREFLPNYGALEQPGVEEDRGDVLEADSRLREVRHLADRAPQVLE